MTAIIVTLLVAGVVSQILSVVRLGKNVKARLEPARYVFILADLRRLALNKGKSTSLMTKFLFLVKPTRHTVKPFFLMLVGVALGIVSYVIRNLMIAGWSSGEWVASPAEVAFCYFTGGVGFLFLFPIVRLFLHRLLATFWHKCMD